MSDTKGVTRGEAVAALVDEMCHQFMLLIEENAHQLVGGTTMWSANLRKLDTLRRKVKLTVPRSTPENPSHFPRPRGHE